MKELLSYNGDIRKNTYLNWRTDQNDQIGNLCVLGDDFAAGAEQLMNSILENNCDKKADALIMHILYCIDQYIELTTKAIIWCVEDLLRNARSKINTHDIVVVDIEKLSEWFQQIRDSLNGLYLMYSTEFEYHHNRVARQGEIE